jgi:tetratricopeptide (TPR) repeat protein
MGSSKKFLTLSNQELEKQATDLRNNGQINGAVTAYHELTKRFEAVGDAKDAANMQHMIGVSYKIANNTAAALAALADAKQRYEKINDWVGVGRVLRDEGITYQYVHDFDHAHKLLEESIEILNGTDAFAELGISQSKLGNLYLEQGKLAQAETWLARGLGTLNKTNHWFYTATTRLHIAGLHLKRHED